LIYPNPFTSNGFVVRTEGDFLYRLSDVSGYVLETGTGNQYKTVGKDLKPGVYLISVENKSEVIVKKVVKEY
jgi:hypothetical protein